MFNLRNEEMQATIGRNQCWFYGYRVDDRRKMERLIDIFCGDIVTGMPIGEVCVFFIKARDYVKILKSESWGWELEVLTSEASKPYLELEEVTRYCRIRVI